LSTSFLVQIVYRIVSYAVRWRYEVELTRPAAGHWPIFPDHGPHTLTSC